ncbi:MAG: hypothetical protein HYX67_03655 [Candidatus Melainabacteria bacterium]|nr:hypothetical protein [Candidatus Melainabacteria bacterium]
MSAFRAIGVGMVLLSTAMTVLIGSPAHAADWDTSIADSRASGSYQEFDLGSTNSTVQGEAQVAGIAGGVASSGAAGRYGGSPNAQARTTPVASHTTRAQRVRLAPATSAILDRTFGRLGFLPPTSMESFVLNSAGAADLIYGDEGTDGPPPFEGFDESHRINTGIYTPGLTTGHRSALPEAWGYPN